MKIKRDYYSKPFIINKDENDMKFKEIRVPFNDILFSNKSLVKLCINNVIVFYPYHNNITRDCHRKFNYAKENEIDITIHVCDNVIYKIKLEMDDD